MAQSVSNVVKSTNPTAGLLGLTPKPKAPSSLFGPAQTSTPQLPPALASPFNFGTTPGVQTKSPLQAGSLNIQNPPQSSGSQYANVQPVTPQSNAVSTGTTPLINTNGSGGTLNPNYNLQTGGSATTPTRGLFPDVLSSLAYTSATKNNDLGANAQKIAADYGQQIADVGGQGARFIAGQKTTGTTPVAEGNAAVTAQTTAAQQQALAAGESAALQGNQQAISAQGQTQSALTSAGGLAQPSPAAYGQTSFDPATNSYSGGGSLPADVMQQYAQMASNGQYAAIPSFITSNPVLNAQLNVAAKALNPSYTPVGAQGASGVLAGVPALQSANTAADGIKNQIQTYLQSNPQLNSSDLAVGNQIQQWLQGKQLTDPKYQTLFNYLDEYTNTLAPILGVGGNPTNLKTEIAQGFINAAASGQSISTVLDAMSTLATHKIQDIQNGAVGQGTSVPTAASQASGGGFATAW